MLMLAEGKQQTLLLGFIMSRKWSFLRHLVLLIPLASVFIPGIRDGAETIPNFERVITAVYEHGIFMFCLSVVLVYLNLWVLIPRLLFKDRYFLYAMAFFGAGFLYYLGELLHGKYAYKGLEGDIQVTGFNVKDIIDNTLLPLIFFGATAGYKVFKKWIIDTRRLNDLQREQLQEELTHLKNQVNPHFLFNTLNNLDTLLQTDKHKASQVVHGLSDVLKYQIYDSNKELILLSKDIEIISRFLMLEKIRRDRFNYEIRCTDNIDGILVPPLLFINFIDNALKHSVDNRNESYITITFSIIQRNLFFVVENSKPAFSIPKDKGGIGLKNIQRRLELLYGSNYELTLTDHPKSFHANLKISL